MSAKDGTRERLLDAATEVFALRGFDAGTVREITTRAGVNVASVNYHFNHKAELYEATINRALERAFLPAEMPTATGPDAPWAVRAVVRDLVLGSLRAATVPMHIRLLSTELHRPTGALRSAVREAIWTRAPRIEPRRLRRTGEPTELEVDDAILVAHWLLGSCLIALQLAPDIAYGDSASAVQYQQRLVDRLTRLIAAGLAGFTA